MAPPPLVAWGGLGISMGRPIQISESPSLSLNLAGSSPLLGGALHDLAIQRQTLAGSDLVDEGPRQVVGPDPLPLFAPLLPLLLRRWHEEGIHLFRPNPSST